MQAAVIFSAYNTADETDSNAVGHAGAQFNAARKGGRLALVLVVLGGVNSLVMGRHSETQDSI